MANLGGKTRHELLSCRDLVVDLYEWRRDVEIRPCGSFVIVEIVVDSREISWGNIAGDGSCE